MQVWVVRCCEKMLGGRADGTDRLVPLSRGGIGRTRASTGVGGEGGAGEKREGGESPGTKRRWVGVALCVCRSVERRKVI